MKKLFLLTLLASSAFAENSFNLSDGSMYWLGRGYDTFKQKGAASCLTLNPNSTETVSSSGKINFFPLPDFVERITHIALSPNKKTLFLCEHHHMQPGKNAETRDLFMSIYDLKNPDQPRILKS